jgi:hypothetical protein
MRMTSKTPYEEQDCTRQKTKTCHKCPNAQAKIEYNVALACWQLVAIPLDREYRHDRWSGGVVYSLSETTHKTQCTNSLIPEARQYYSPEFASYRLSNCYTKVHFFRKQRPCFKLLVVVSVSKASESIYLWTVDLEQVLTQPSTRPIN